jgi:hypothetical protein
LNTKLRELLVTFFSHPDAAVIDEIVNLHASKLDFSDELLDSFTAQEREFIYFGLKIFCWDHAEEILRHRLLVEKDPECRKELETLFDRSATRSKPLMDTKKAQKKLLRYKERTPEFEKQLKDTVLLYLKNPKDEKAAREIDELEPTDRDFSDKLLDSLAPRDRLEVYATLLRWCGYAGLRRILERRVELEKDPVCARAVSVMLADLRQCNPTYSASSGHPPLR